MPFSDEEILKEILLDNSAKGQASYDPIQLPIEEIFFNGQKTIISTSNYISRIIANNNKFFKVKLDEVDGQFNFMIKINITSDIESIHFSSSDLRLYEPFFLLTRKMKLPSRINGNNLNSFIRGVVIYVPHMRSFEVIKNVLGAFDLYINFISRLKPDSSEIIERSNCILANCRMPSLYYPKICNAHLWRVQQRDIPKLLTDDYKSIDYDTFTNIDIGMLFKGIVKGGRNYSEDRISTAYSERCWVCNSKASILSGGICADCYLYFNMELLIDDYNNSLVSIAEIKDGEWKNYLSCTYDEFMKYLLRKKKRIEREREMKENLMKQKNIETTGTSLYEYYNELDQEVI